MLHQELRHFTIPVFVPELACPNRCSFCNQFSITGKPQAPNPGDIPEMIRKYLATFPENAIVEMGFFGGNFTGIPENEQITYLDKVQPFLSSGQIQSIRISTRPDYINLPVLEMLTAYHVYTIELGAQSMDEEVLRLNSRGHTADDTRTASRLIKKMGFRLGLQMMAGLPGDTHEKTLETALEIIRLGADETRIYPALVIRGTLMEQWYRAGKYTPLTTEEAISWVKPCVEKFEEAGVKILRAGLHSSDGLTSGTDLLDGPFHPSFRELVYSAIWNDRFRTITEISDYKKLSIFVPVKSYNSAIGYRAENRKMLLRTFQNVKFYRDPALKNFEFHVDYS